MTEEKQAETGTGDPSERVPCRGVTRAGSPCRYAARFPSDAPVWCLNCDPSPEAVERRRTAGSVRHKRFSRIPTVPIGESRSIPPGAVPTIDYLVDLCLDAAMKVERGEIEPPAGQAIKGLLGKALDAMKARATTGDARGAGDRETKTEKVSPRESTMDAGDLSSLERALDA